MEKPKQYDLEQRTESFSLAIRDFCLSLKKDIINRELIQVVRSAGSVAENYIEANENLGRNDLKMRIKICRKDSKESRLWLKHVLTYEIADLETRRNILVAYAIHLAPGQ